MVDEPAQPSRFSGFYNPRSTAVPDNFFDEVLPELSGAEVKVLLYIFRRTFGFKRDSDNISLSQMVAGITRRDGRILDRGTGLGKTSVARALKQLVKKGYVKKTKRRTDRDGDQPTTYEPVMAAADPVSQNGTGGVPESDKGLSQNGTHKKQGNNKQSDNTVNGAESPLKELPDQTIEPERADLLAGDVIEQLNDETSAAFYRLAVHKVPEQVIRQTLAEIKADGARQPARLFTYRLHRWALDRLTSQLKH